MAQRYLPTATLMSMLLLYSAEAQVIPSFKGLQPGMSLNEIDTLVSQTGWDKQYPYSWPSASDTSWQIYVGLDRGLPIACEDTFAVFLRYEEGHSVTCAKVEGAYLSAFRGRVQYVAIDLSSELYQQEMLRNFVAALEEKYGKATKSAMRKSDALPADFYANRSFVLVEWSVPRNAKKPLYRIQLKFSWSDKGFYDILLTMLDLESEREEERQEEYFRTHPKVKSNF